MKDPFFCPACGAGTKAFDELCSQCQQEAKEAFDAQAERQSRIYRGELEVTDADGVQTMRDFQ